MSDPRLIFSADDLNSAFWRGYFEGLRNAQTKASAAQSRSPVPRIYWLMAGVMVSIGLWLYIVIPGALALIRFVASLLP